MDSNQMPPIQNYGTGQPVQTQQYYTAEQVAKMMEPKKDVAGIVKTIIIILLALLAATFIGLFVWAFLRYDEAATDVSGQIAVAVAAAQDAQRTEDDARYAEEAKYPYYTFAGPADYGQLSFEYPKTWSVYVAADAANGGDYEAHFNPKQVNEVSDETLDALKVVIRDDSFDTVAAEYQKEMNKRNANLTVGTITVNGVVGNIYTGTIPDTEFSGYIVIFKIRDKTAIIQTDSVLFKEEFDKLIQTVKFNA